MSSKSEQSTDRNKVDFQLIDTVIPQHMENGSDALHQRERDSLQSESSCDLRKSLAWDSAFFTSPGVLDPEELLETLNFQVMDDGAAINGHKEPKSLLSESIVTARTSGVGNLRRSLAWDSAFFTSAGVLDAEELSILNKGFKRPEELVFPGFDEEIWRSVESNSTITSDGYSLASLEVDLFDDPRASIHKSLNVSSNGATSACKLKSEKGSKNGHASKILDRSSRARADQKKNVASSGESRSLLSVKPPKISGHASHSPIVPSKRASWSGNHARRDNKTAKSASGKSMIMSKKMCLRESCSTIPSSKSPSSVLAAATNGLAGFIHNSADFTGKSNLLRRTTDPSSSTSGSSLRTLKYSVGNKTELMNSSDSVCLLSTPKSSAYASPAGSIDGWSSDSSSTSIKQRSNSSVAVLVNTPSRAISFDSSACKPSDSERDHYGQLRLGYDIRETKFTNPQIYDIRIHTSPAPANVSKKLRPSGLRMPSPKIGFFDTENSACIAQNGGLKFQSGLQGTSKNGSGISNVNGSATRTTRYGKHQLTRTSTGIVNKTGMKDEGKVCLRDKQKPLKERGDFRLQFPENNVHRLGEDNKENIGSLANQVHDLSRRIGGINFSSDERK